MESTFSLSKSMTNDSEANSSSDSSSFEPIYLVRVTWGWRLIGQLILAIIGILGNSLVIHVYLHARNVKKASTNIFIAALAVADLLTSIFILPYPTLSRVPDNFGGHVYCKLVESMNVMWVSIVASVFTLTTLAVERFVAIVYPLHYKAIFTIKTTKRIIAMIWLSAFSFNTFEYYVVHNFNGQCIHDFGSVELQVFIGVSTLLVKYLMPVTVMLTANMLAIRSLKIQAISLATSRVQLPSTANPTLNLLRARQRVINMLMVVIVTFVICWSPDQFAFFAFNLGLIPVQYINGNVFDTFVLLAFVNSCINPIIYTLTNRNFREALKQPLFSSASHLQNKPNNLFATPLEVSDVSGSISKTDEKTYETTTLDSHTVGATLVGNNI